MSLQRLKFWAKFFFYLALVTFGFSSGIVCTIVMAETGDTTMAGATATAAVIFAVIAGIVSLNFSTKALERAEMGR